MDYVRGRRALQRLLAERCCDVRELDLPGFRRWLAALLGRWRRDPVFRQRVRLRELRRAHPDLVEAERRYRRALRQDAAGPLFGALAARERQLHDLGRAVDGLTAALAAASEARRPALARKLEAYLHRHRESEAALSDLLRQSPERREVQQARAGLDELRRATGVDVEEERLHALLRGHGHGAGRSGRSFEALAAGITPQAVGPNLRVLQGVTLGAADTELDQLLVRVRPERPVEVVALVEVKRSLDDLAHGFRKRQGNLAWLTGEGSYDPAGWRTRTFPTGHFDRPAVHVQDGEEFLLTRDSFRRFRRDPVTGHFLERLYFVTRPGRLRGLSSAALARVAARVASDLHWNPRDPHYLEGLLDWCRSLAHELESPDVLRLYAASPARARQILLVGQAVLAGNSQSS